MRYRKKSVIIEAEQWQKVTYDKEAGHGISSEDMPIYHLQVGYYRTPDMNGQDKCKYCGDIMHNHGWIDIPKSGCKVSHIVCPGDWIIKRRNEEPYPCKPEIFERTYEPIKD